jgi:hypothetical protein
MFDRNRRKKKTGRARLPVVPNQPAKEEPILAAEASVTLHPNSCHSDARAKRDRRNPLLIPPAEQKNTNLAEKLVDLYRDFVLLMETNQELRNEV